MLAGYLLAALGVAACGGSSKSPSAEVSASSTSVTAPLGYQASHAGGTLHLLLNASAGSIDPVPASQVPIVQADADVYDGLMGFVKAPGPAGNVVVPDLARSMPLVSNGGKTYTFTLRKGIRFSNGTLVTVQDVLSSLRRIYTVPSGVAGGLFTSFVGASLCLKTPSACTLAGGVSADPSADTVTITLTAPDPNILLKLALPAASIVPPNAPRHNGGDTPIPGTGPYMVASYGPNSALTLVRNPYFREWSAAAQPQGYPNEIVETFGVPVESEVTEVEQGQADGVLDPLPADRLTELSTKYASQVHVSLTPDTNYFALNTRVPPFTNLAARQAVNWAINRDAVVRLLGGTQVATPLCTFLPPSVPGYEHTCQYTIGSSATYSGPDLTKARQLMRQSGDAGAPVSVYTANDPVSEAMGGYMVSVLNQLGFKGQLRALTNAVVGAYFSNSKNKVQAMLSGWFPDYVAPSDYLLNNLSCASFYPDSAANYNQAEFCNKPIDAQMYRALSAQATAPARADSLWAKADEAVMRLAPEVPLYANKQVDFVSKRVGHYAYNDQFYMLIDQLWVR
jgi:peptide/nickel transport system substrate-binding protein